MLYGGVILWVIRRCNFVCVIRDSFCVIEESVLRRCHIVCFIRLSHFLWESFYMFYKVDSLCICFKGVILYVL